MQIADEGVRLDLEDAVWCDEHLDNLMATCLEDFLDDDMSELADYAARIAHGSITDQTRDGHSRLVLKTCLFIIRTDLFPQESSSLTSSFISSTTPAGTRLWSHAKPLMMSVNSFHRSVVRKARGMKAREYVFWTHFHMCASDDFATSFPLLF